MTYFDIEKIDPRSPAEGVEMRIIHGERMTMAFIRVEPGAEVPEHSHPHEQVGTVLKGSIEMDIGGNIKVVTAGTAYHVPSDTIHKGRCLDSPTEILEVFTPVREDLR